jgi:hypothetical protein
MPDDKIPTAPAAMEGHGGYNERSAVQARGASTAVPLIEQAAERVELPSGSSPVVVADYGSSEGRNSLAPMAAAVRKLRDRLGPDRAIWVVHTDQPDNDFSALFDVLATDPTSYLRTDGAVYASAVGASFYGQILPSDQVSVGWSSWAVQWLSRTPVPIRDHVQIGYSRDEEARAVYAAQAARDWESFLRCRSRELHRGGRLVVLTMATGDDGQFGYRPVLDAMNTSLLEMASDGLLRIEEVQQMTIPTYARTRAELSAPFATGSFEGLTLDRLSLFEGDDAIWQRFTHDRDAEAYGRSWAAFSRASVFPTLTLGLDGGSHDPRAQRFAATLESKMVERLANDPQPSQIPLAVAEVVA